MSVGSAETHSSQRKRLRKKLRQAGKSAAEIEAAVEAMRRRQESARSTGVPLAVAAPKPRRRRRGRYVVVPGYTPEQRQAIEDATYERFALPDGAHRHHSVDPLLTGAARATGATAKAVKRRKGVVKWELEEAPTT